MKTNEPPTEEPPPPPALPDIAATEEKTTDKGDKPVPNSKPRPAPLTPGETYVYKDYAQTPLESLDTDTCHKKIPPACLQAQKLPSKMAVMLVDPGELRTLVFCYQMIPFFLLHPSNPSADLHHNLICRSYARYQLVASRKKLEDLQP
jgi:hypothetical protein